MYFWVNKENNEQRKQETSVDASIGCVVQHLADDASEHLFEFVEELAWLVGAVFDVAQVFFPDTRQLGTFQHLLVDDVNEVDACLGGL